MMKKPDEVIRKLTQINGLGIGISINDFKLVVLILVAALPFSFKNDFVIVSNRLILFSLLIANLVPIVPDGNAYISASF
jgi:hypothetical protein